MTPEDVRTRAAKGAAVPALPDEDRMTSVVLSKVLLLVEDDKITDRSILTQLERASRRSRRGVSWSMATYPPNS
jgi:predicted metalloprotease